MSRGGVVGLVTAVLIESLGAGQALLCGAGIGAVGLRVMAVFVTMPESQTRLGRARSR